MKIISRQKCAISSKEGLRSYYQRLSKEELEKRKSSQLNVFLTTSLAWVTSLIAVIVAAKISFPLIILYFGVIISLLITTRIDYRQRISLIDDALRVK